jgi:hypothetical protein
MALATLGEEGLLKQMTIRNEEHGAYLRDVTPARKKRTGRGGRG